MSLDSVEDLAAYEAMVRANFSSECAVGVAGGRLATDCQVPER
jgi:hypothetical protein